MSFAAEKLYTADLFDVHGTFPNFTLEFERVGMALALTDRRWPHSVTINGGTMDGAVGGTVVDVDVDAGVGPCGANAGATLMVGTSIAAVAT